MAPGLDARAVEQKGRDLLKAAEASAPTTTLLALLSDLRSGVVASEMLLRSTKIGVTVNKLKQHKDQNVARTASELVSKWRTDISKNRGASGASTPKPGAPGSPVPAKGKSATEPGAAEVVKQKLEKSTVPKEKRNSREDKVSTKVTGNDTRDNCVRLMYDGIAFMSEQHPEDVLRVAISVEVAAFATYGPETSDGYRTKIRSLFQNLKNNQQLRDNVYDGSIKPERFVKMTHEELKSADRRAQDALMMKENMKAAMVAQEEKSVSTQLQCSKCGQRRVSYTQAQTRSADEPMTTFCECLVCGKRWKFS